MIAAGCDCCQLCVTIYLTNSFLQLQIYTPHHHCIIYTGINHESVIQAAEHGREEVLRWLASPEGGGGWMHTLLDMVSGSATHDIALQHNMTKHYSRW